MLGDLKAEGRERKAGHWMVAAIKRGHGVVCVGRVAEGLVAEVRVVVRGER